VVTGAMGEPHYHDLPDLMRDAFQLAFAGAAEPLRPKTFHSGLKAQYRFDDPDGMRSLHIGVDGDAIRLTIDDDTGHHVLSHRAGHWVEQRTGVSTWRLHHSYQDEEAPVLAGAEWSDTGEQLHLTWHFIEAPFIDRLTLTFSRDGVSVDRSVNVNSGPTELPTVHGELVTA
jgi:hypothetical protein